MSLGTAYQNLRRHQDALAPFTRAAGLLEHAPNPNVLFHSLARTGQSLQALERFAEAEEAFRRAITIADTKGGCDELEVAQVLTFMLVEYERQHRIGDGLAIAERVLAICEKRLPADSPLVAQSHVWLATVAQDQRDFDKAIVHFKAALAIYDDESHRNEERVAFIAANLGQIYLQQSRYGEAERCCSGWSQSARKPSLPILAA
jgi:tetratricopeptide (TPR) repeat protein